MNDAWQAPMADLGPQGADQGKGGKYVIVPPGYKGKIPGGYIKVQAPTFNGYSVMRAIPLSNSEEDQKKVMELAQKLKIYPLAQAAKPSKTRFIDMRQKFFNGIAKFDESFYFTLAKMMNEEPILSQDFYEFTEGRCGFVQ